MPWKPPGGHAFGEAAGSGQGGNPLRPFCSVRGFQISAKLFSSMPAEYQKVLMEEFLAGGVKVTKVMSESQEDYVKKLTEAGVKIVNPDIAQYKPRSSRSTPRRRPSGRPTTTSRFSTR